MTHARRTPNAGKPWSDADDARLIALRRRGRTWEELGALFGRSPHATEQHWSLVAGDVRDDEEELDDDDYAPHRAWLPAMLGRGLIGGYRRAA